VTAFLVASALARLAAACISPVGIVTESETARCPADESWSLRREAGGSGIGQDDHWALLIHGEEAERARGDWLNLHDGLNPAGSLFVRQVDRIA
jgi:hypothetical protein